MTITPYVNGILFIFLDDSHVKQYRSCENCGVARRVLTNLLVSATADRWRDGGGKGVLTCVINKHATCLCQLYLGVLSCIELFKYLRMPLL